MRAAGAAACPVRPTNLPVESLDFLRGSNVHELKIEECGRLRDISALSETPGLTVLFINRCGPAPGTFRPSAAAPTAAGEPDRE